MTIQASIFQDLRDRAAVAALVGDRIFPEGEAPSAVGVPYITFGVLDTEHARHLGGGVGLARTRMRISCWGDSQSQALEVMHTVRERLDNLQNKTLGATSTTNVRHALLVDDDTGFIQPSDASGASRHEASMQFMIWHAESVTPVT